MPTYRTPVDLTGQELRNATIQNLSADPGSPVAGRLYYKTGDNTVRVYNGTSFVALSTGSAPAATTGAEGIVQLAGDLGGNGTTAAAPLISTASQLINGLVGTPSVRFQNSQSSGLYSSATNHVSLSANGVQCLDSTSTVTTLPLAVTASLGVTITAGGLTVSSGGATISGTTAITGALSTTGGSGTATFSQQLTVSAGGITVTTGGATISGTVGITGGTTVTGALSTSGGSGTATFAQALTVTAGGAAITGTSSVAGAFSTTGGSGTITSAQQLTVSAGGITVSAGGAAITGATSVAGALSTTGGSGTATFSQALTVSAGGATVAGNSSITGTLNMNSNQINGVANATLSTDVPNLGQVQALVQGQSAKPAAHAATNAETLTITAGSVTTIAGTTVDGITIAIGDRILIANAPAATGAASGPGYANFTSQPANGLYLCTANTTNLTVSREPELSGTNGPAGAYVFVSAGAAASSGFTVLSPTTNVGFTYGTTAMSWTQFSGAGEITAGTGLSKSGNTISIENSGVLLPAHGGSGVASPTSHNVLIGAGASAFTLAAPSTAGLALVSAGATSDPAFGALNLTAAGSVTNALPIANGGTASTTAAAARTALAAGAVDTTTLASGSSSYTFTPAPAPKTNGVWQVSVINQTTQQVEYADVTINSALNTPVTGPVNQITVAFGAVTAVNYSLIAVG